MYACLNCFREFSKPEIRTEYHPYGKGYAPEQYLACPFCSGSYERLYECAGCGCEFKESEITDIDGNLYCEDCAEKCEDEGDELMMLARLLGSRFGG